MSSSRRRVLEITAKIGLALCVYPFAARATRDDVTEALRSRIGVRNPTAGGITLQIPRIAETGNSVPITIRVDSPMTPEAHVERVHVFVEGNPEPVAATFHLGPRTGIAEISTRVRLARSQNVLAVAEMSDGSVRSDSVSVIVTLGACLEEIWTD